MKRKWIYLILLIVILLIILGYFLFLKYNNNEIDKLKHKNLELINNNNIKLEYGTIWGYEDFIKNLILNKNNQKVIFYVSDKKIKKDFSFNTVGKYDVKIEIIDQYNYKIIPRKLNVISTRNIEILVEDTNYPIIEGLSDKSIYQGEKIDLKEGITSKDIIDGDLDFEISGDFDNNTPGEYKLIVTSTDKNENLSSESFTVQVKSKPKIETIDYEQLIQKKDDMYYVDGTLIVNKSYSLPSNYNPGGLLSIFRNNMDDMKKDASCEGINLWVVSGYRSYNSQKSIYNNYVSIDGQELADTYSARPGHSEHQTGLAADINLIDQSFISTKEGLWLNNNCYKYGFIIRYPEGKQSVTGYKYEPWHIRYVGVDLATKLYNSGNWIILEEYYKIPSEY